MYKLTGYVPLINTTNNTGWQFFWHNVTLGSNIESANFAYNNNLNISSVPFGGQHTVLLDLTSGSDTVVSFRINTTTGVNSISTGSTERAWALIEEVPTKAIAFTGPTGPASTSEYSYAFKNNPQTITTGTDVSWDTVTVDGGGTIVFNGTELFTLAANETYLITGSLSGVYNLGSTEADYTFTDSGNTRLTNAPRIRMTSENSGANQSSADSWSWILVVGGSSVTLKLRCTALSGVDMTLASPANQRDCMLTIVRL